MYNWCVQLYGGVGVPFVEPFVATNSSIAVLAGGYLQRLGTRYVLMKPFQKILFRVRFFYRKGVVIPFQIGFFDEKDPHPLG